MKPAKRAVIIGYKDPSITPRILKEIDWLQSSGWVVDTVGIGPKSPAKGTHFEIRFKGLAARTKAYLSPNHRRRFDLLYGTDLEGLTNLSLPDYELIVIHEPGLLPSRTLSNEVLRRSGKGVYLDLHEDHLNTLSRNWLERAVFEEFRAWERVVMADLVAAAPSLKIGTVSPEIGTRYEKFFGRPVAIVRNAPPGLDLKPSSSDLGRIALVHHGVGTTHRGIEKTIKALRKLSDQFEFHLHLVSTRSFLIKLRLIALVSGVSNRVFIHDPVPTKEISRCMNKYDVAMVVIEPITANELDAFPNKFFESIQARLAIVVGPNPSMAQVVESSGAGLVMAGWSVSDIVEALRKITRHQIRAMKLASDAIASEMSSERDRDAFLNHIDPRPH